MRIDSFMVFTTTEGGWFKAVRSSREDFDRAVEDGFLTSPVSGERIPLALAALATVTDFKDFRER